MRQNHSRRTFLGTATTLAAATTMSRAAPEKTIVVGIMGTGGRGKELARVFASQPNVTVAFLADPDSTHLTTAANLLVKANHPQPKIVTDFRKILDEKTVDVLVCAAPNHWHAPAGILACAAGKHAYIEKPCSHTPQEGQWLVEAARKNQRIVQMGNQRRSWPKIIEAMHKLQNGVIGRVYFAQAWYTADRGSIGVGKAIDPPKELDYDLWQGPANRLAFRSNYLHYNWHWFWQWGNGELGNNGIHMIDLLRWGLGVTYPSQVVSSGGRYRFQDDQQTPDTHIVSYNFPEGKTLMWEGFSCNRIPREKAIDCLFQGENGSLTIAGGSYTIYDAKGKEVAKEAAPKLGETEIHVANFLAAVRGETKPNSEIAEGATSTLLCHLGNIAHRTGRSLLCDPKTGTILNDADAMKLWSKVYATGWAPNG
jgi:predicted dehydrogenase